MNTEGTRTDAEKQTQQDRTTTQSNEVTTQRGAKGVTDEDRTVTIERRGTTGQNTQKSNERIRTTRGTERGEGLGHTKLLPCAESAEISIHTTADAR